MRLIGPPLHWSWWGTAGHFLAAPRCGCKTYEETRAADVLFDAGMTPDPAAFCLLTIMHASWFTMPNTGKRTFYGKRWPECRTVEPIARNDLWTGKFADDMNSWIVGSGVEYTDLSLRRHDLGHVIRLVKRAVKEHEALLAWCHQHASIRSN